jgi:hypothetical protein
MASAGDGGDDDDLWAQETLKFASAGLAAAQHLRESKKKTPPPLTAAPPLLQSSDFASTTKATVGSDDGDELVRDADGDLAGIDNADDYVTFEGDSEGDSDDNSEGDSEGEGDRGLRRVKKLDRSYIKLPEIKGVGLSGVRDIDMEDVRQQAMLAQLRRKQANFLDTVKGLNITNLQMHAREYAPTLLREGSLCEIIFEIKVEKLGDGGETTEVAVTMPALKIPFTGSLEFLDTEEERKMFHDLDGKPWKDKLKLEKNESGEVVKFETVEEREKMPEWAKERLGSLEAWLKSVDAWVNNFKKGPDSKKLEDYAKDSDSEDKNKAAATAAAVYSKTAGTENIYLDINDFVGWTYLYRFMNVPDVAFAIIKLTGFLFPMNLFQDFKDFSWLFQGREKVLIDLAKRLPSPFQMLAFSEEAKDLDAMKEKMGYNAESNKTDIYAQEDALSYTWSFMFILLFFRQVLAHEFFMFATYKHIVAPVLEASTSGTKLSVNIEETKDDFMHQKWREILDKFALFRDTLTGRQDNFTKYFQRYMNLAHERVKISHERNMVRSEEVVYKTVISTIEDQDGFSKEIKAAAETENGDTGAALRIISEKPIFNIKPTLPPESGETVEEATTEEGGGLVRTLLSAVPTGIQNTFETMRAILTQTA